MLAAELLHPMSTTNSTTLAVIYPLLAPPLLVIEPMSSACDQWLSVKVSGHYHAVFPITCACRSISPCQRTHMISLLICDAFPPSTDDASEFYHHMKQMLEIARPKATPQATSSNALPRLGNALDLAFDVIDNFNLYSDVRLSWFNSSANASISDYLYTSRLTLLLSHIRT
jgi:hypothetical protein